MESKSTKNSSVKDEKENSWENKTSGNEEPVWYANIQQPIKFTKLTRNSSSIDVIVVGGGIAGMTTAHLIPYRT